MLQKINLEHILFLDIETVPLHESFAKLSDIEKTLWTEKTTYQRKDEISAEAFYERAGIWAEFGKIVCISVGHFVTENQARRFRVTSFTGEEPTLLQAFSDLLENYFNKPEHLLCAHNGKEFDFPFIARRLLIQQMPIPYKLKLFGKKPWEIPHLDTLELWKFGDYKTYTSLKLLTHVLNVPSPKQDIDGSQVREVYYQDQDVKRIAAYCEQDTIAVAQLLLRYRNEDLLNPSEIIHI